jgi:hypothetical protein
LFLQSDIKYILGLYVSVVIDWGVAIFQFLLFLKRNIGENLCGKIDKQMCAKQAASSFPMCAIIINIGLQLIFSAFA